MRTGNCRLLAIETHTELTNDNTILSERPALDSGLHDGQPFSRIRLSDNKTGANLQRLSSVFSATALHRFL